MVHDSNWFCLRVVTRHEYSDLAAQALHESGCSGVQIEDTELRDRGEDADFIAREEVVVTGYFEQQNPKNQTTENLVADLRQRLQEYSVPATVDCDAIEQSDWSTSWRENFPPLRIGKFLIVPTWEESTPDADAILLRLDPGLAFGTGQHPTTKMCLELLSDYSHLLKGARLLDVGCGSGVLALAAAKLGAQVTASDFDPHCIAATRENAELNEVSKSINAREVAGLDWCDETFPVVIANLMSDLLISLASELRRVTQDKSTLMVSGISSPRADEVQAALEAAGFQRIEKREQDGEMRGEIQERWAAFVFHAV